MALSLKGHIITVFGGTGFAGRHIIKALADAGARIRVATRQTNSAYFLRLYGQPGQIVPVQVSYQSETSVDNAVAGSTLVINCLGILHQRRKAASFSHVHNDIPVWIARACYKHRIRKFIHISALGIDTSRSKYAASKLKGEFGVTSVFPRATILRPSVIFGPEDNFFNKFDRMARISPALPLIGGGHTQFQPVYAGDIAAAVMASIANPDTNGQIYELGGPEILSFRAILERLAAVTGRRRRFISLPWWLARLQAFLLAWLPDPPLTNDQITSLQSDSVVNRDHKNFADLGIVPTPLDAILPLYLRKDAA